MLVIFLLLFAGKVFAATTLHGTTTVSGLSPNQTQGIQGGCAKTSSSTPWDYAYFLMDTTAPSSGTSEVFIPTASSPPCFFQRASGSQYIFFVSKPLSASVTLGGTLNGKCSGIESAAGQNSGCSFLVYRYDGRTQAFADVLWTSGTTGEYSTSCATATIPSGSSPAVTLNIGDRIIVAPEVQAAGGVWGGNGSRTTGLCWNGAAAGANEVSITFSETMTFSADTTQPGLRMTVGD